MVPEVYIVEVEVLAVGEGQGCEFVELQRDGEQLRDAGEVDSDELVVPEVDVG